MLWMEPKFTKYKELIELQLEVLTADNALGQSAQKTVELDQQSVGRLSRMDALQSQAMAQAQQRRRDVLKGSLQAALLRLKEEEFGYCLECGDEIEEACLLANPAVIRNANLHLVSVRSPSSVAGQTLLPRFCEVLRPSVVDALRDTLTTAQLCDVVFATQAVQDNPDLLFG
jgi:DnaK suppressor protein